MLFRSLQTTAEAVTPLNSRFSMELHATVWTVTTPLETQAAKPAQLVDQAARPVLLCLVMFVGHKETPHLETLVVVEPEPRWTPPEAFVEIKTATTLVEHAQIHQAVTPVMITETVGLCQQTQEGQVCASAGVALGLIIKDSARSATTLAAIVTELIRLVVRVVDRMQFCHLRIMETGCVSVEMGTS